MPPFTRRECWQTINGQSRRVEILTFTGTQQGEYDEFLSARFDGPNVDIDHSGFIKNGKEARIEDEGGRLVKARYRRVLFSQEV